MCLWPPVRRTQRRFQNLKLGYDKPMDRAGITRVAFADSGTAVLALWYRALHQTRCVAQLVRQRIKPMDDSSGRR